MSDNHIPAGDQAHTGFWNMCTCAKCRAADRALGVRTTNGPDVVVKLEDLLKQATVERSHYYVGSVCREAIAEIKHLREYERKYNNNRIRTAVADYMRSEGCSCCRGKDHDKHATKLAMLLKVDPYDDASGWDFNKYSSDPIRP